MCHFTTKTLFICIIFANVKYISMCSNPYLMVHPRASLAASLGHELFVDGVLIDLKDRSHFEYILGLRKSILDHFSLLYYSSSSDSKEKSLHYLHETVQSVFYCSSKGVRTPCYVICPCGSCNECLKSRSDEFRTRSIIESSDSYFTIFYTLTYDDEHVPEFGLEQSHVSSAFKLLRRHIERFFGFDCYFKNFYVGEYGTDPRKTMRPHYHGLLYIKSPLTAQQLLKLQDMFKPRKSDCPKGFKPKYGFSKFYEDHEGLEHWWPHGLCFDFDVCYNPSGAASYISKYLVKQYLFRHDSNFCVQKEREEKHWNLPFVCSPKRNALGCESFEKLSIDFINSPDGKVRVRFKDGSVKSVLFPQYYMRKLFPPFSVYCPNSVVHYHNLLEVVNRLLFNKLTLHNTDYEKLLYFFKVLTKYSYIKYFTITPRHSRMCSCFNSFVSHDTPDLEDIGMQLCEILSKCPSFEEYMNNLQERQNLYDKFDFKLTILNSYGKLISRVRESECFYRDVKSKFCSML